MKTICLILALCFAVPAMGQYTIPSRSIIASGIPTHNPGWQWVQGNGGHVAGNGSSTSFTIPFNPPVLLNPLTGDVLVAYIYWSTTAITVTSVSRAAGETWVAAGTGCEITSSTNNNAVAYTLSSVALGTNVTVNFSAAPSNTDTIFVAFEEFSPPAGFTPSQDGNCTNIAPVASCTTCTSASITTTSTDLVIESPAFGGIASILWDSWSSPFQMDYSFEIGFATDVAAGTYQPTFKQSSGSFSAVAIAFKTTAGTYSGPPQTFSVPNLSMSAGTNINCTTPCTVTIPSTTANNALVGWFATATSGVTVTNVTCSGCGTFTLPSGCAINLSGQGAQNCFYLFNIPASVTTLTVTTSSNVSLGYQVFELARANGPWTFDASGSAQRAATSTPNGLSPTITGTVDAVFQSIWQPGGAGFLQWYAAPSSLNNVSPNCTAGCYLSSEANGMAYLNTSNTVVPIWSTNNNTASAVAYFSIK